MFASGYWLQSMTSRWLDIGRLPFLPGFDCFLYLCQLFQVIQESFELYKAKSSCLPYRPGNLTDMKNSVHQQTYCRTVFLAHFGPFLQDMWVLWVIYLDELGRTYRNYVLCLLGLSRGQIHKLQIYLSDLIFSGWHLCFLRGTSGMITLSLGG